jgi:hypothetical protein
MFALFCAVLLALLGAGASPTPPPSPTPAMYVVVQKDGTLIRLQKPPVLKGKNLVGNLWPSGQLVSLPAAGVDDRRTAAANAGGRAATPSSETNIGTRYKPAGPQTPLGDQVKLKGGRKAAERKLQGASGSAKPGGAGTGGPPGKTPEFTEPVDLHGHGESWWRGRAAPLLEERTDAEAELKLAEDERKRFEGTLSPPGQGATATWALELQRLRDREGRSRQRLNAAKRRLVELAEEARKAGAFPGWVR